MRITVDMLERLVDTLNEVQGTPSEPYDIDDNGRLKPNAGNYHLSGAYGGYALDQMYESGGTRDVLGSGHIPKKQLGTLIQAYLQGIREKKAKGES